MNVCMLMDRLGHPVMEAVAHELAERYAANVTLIDVGISPPPGDADVYLLKSRSHAGLAAARRAELRGAQVVNTVTASAACLDRVLMAKRMSDANLPFPATRSAPTLDCLIASLKHELPRPVVVKSRRSRRGDLVGAVHSSAELRALASDWGDEAVIVQAAVEHDGWEYKLWSVGGHLRSLRRGSAFGANGDGTGTLVPVEELPEGIERVARATGAAFGLDLFGVDLLLTERGPVVVDVNPFPGFRSVPAADRYIAAHVIALSDGTRGRA